MKTINLYNAAGTCAVFQDDDSRYSAAKRMGFSFKENPIPAKPEQFNIATREFFLRLTKSERINAEMLMQDDPSKDQDHRKNAAEIRIFFKDAERLPYIDVLAESTKVFTELLANIGAIDKGRIEELLSIVTMKTNNGVKK